MAHSSKGGVSKQNSGAKAHHMRDPHRAGSAKKPSTGESAVEFHGTMVHAKHRAGVTIPSAHNAGSHDHLAREHADHKITRG